METKTNILKRTAEPARKLARPDGSPSEKPEPTPAPSTGVGGSSLDTMTAACASELMNARTSFHKLHLKV